MTAGHGGSVLDRLSGFLAGSIGRRLAVGLGSLLLAGLTVSTVLFVRAEHREMKLILSVKGRTALGILAPRLSRLYDREKPDLLIAELRPLLGDRDFDYAFVFDDDGVVCSIGDPGVAAGARAALPPLSSLRRSRYGIRTIGTTMEVLAPLVVDGRRVAGVGLGVSLNLAFRQVRVVRLRLLLVTLLLMGSTMTLLYWLTRRTVAPLLQLTRGAQRLTEGDLSVRVAVERRDEVGQLARAFNNLAESLERTLREKDGALAEARRFYRNLKVARAQLGRAERLSAVGILAAGVSHELNNPLGIILSTAGNLREALGEDSRWAEDVGLIENQAKRCRAIIQGLLNFAASGERHLEDVDVNQLLRDTFALAVRDERARRMTAGWQLDARLPRLRVDRRQMQQVFLNLILNAANAVEGEGLLTVRTAAETRGGRRLAVLEFADQGCGIAPADLEHIFDPFYTTKKAGTGFGLGLAVSYGIVAAHGGEITVASEVGRGATFRITLPIHPTSPAVFPASGPQRG